MSNNLEYAIDQKGLVKFLTLEKGNMYASSSDLGKARFKIVKKGNYAWELYDKEGVPATSSASRDDGGRVLVDVFPEYAIAKYHATLIAKRRSIVADIMLSANEDDVADKPKLEPTLAEPNWEINGSLVQAVVLIWNAESMQLKAASQRLDDMFLHAANNGTDVSNVSGYHYAKERQVALRAKLEGMEAVATMLNIELKQFAKFNPESLSNL